MRTLQRYVPDYPFTAIPALGDCGDLHETNRRFATHGYIRVSHSTLQRDLVDRLGLVFRTESKNKPLGAPMRSLQSPKTTTVAWLCDLAHYSIYGEHLQSYGHVMLRGVRYLVVAPPLKPRRP